MAKEFGRIRKLRPNLKKAVLHVSISAAPGEKLSDAQWIEIGNKYLKSMGLEESQFVVTRHTDTDHEHIHILANRIRFDGTVVSDSNDYKRQEKLMRELERDYALTPVGASKEAAHKALTNGEVEKAIRLGERPPRLILQELVTAATGGRPSTIEFVRRLEAKGIGVVANIASTGKMNGFSFTFSGVAFSGSKLGEKYKWSELQKVIQYEQTRDSEQLAARGNAARRNAIAERNRELGDNGFIAVAIRSVPAEHATVRSAAPMHDSDIKNDEHARRVDRIITQSSLEEAGRGADAGRKAENALRKDHKKIALDSRLRRPLFANIPADIPQSRSRHRQQMLEKTYGQSSEKLAKYWRVDKSLEGVVFTNRDGRVVDRGLSIHCDRGNGKEIEAMIELAKIKGWRSLTVRSGSDDFRYRAMTALLRAGFDVVANTACDRVILQKARDDLAGVGGSAIGRISRHNVAIEKIPVDAGAAVETHVPSLLGGEDQRAEARQANRQIRLK
ncbi:hypothetical protein CR103_13890 [Massilia psychrophila]|uniref:Uncharacterized protein n=2 Tax=Massilia psychrophila TaxID=1603353 RepID=A0A2G8SZD8_9BURK|nr:hypothetical protein CR103_13890 [Massilia psychrophila]